MSSKFKKTLSFILAMIIFCTAFAALTTYSYAEENAKASAAVEALAKKSGFAPGSPAMDCYAFANKVSNALYGVGLPGVGTPSYTFRSSSDWVKIGTLSGAACTQETLTKLLKSARPGDMLQMYWLHTFSTGKSSQHTAVVYSCDNDSIMFWQGGYSFGEIKLKDYDYETLSKRFSASPDHGVSLYRYSNYDKLFPGSTPTEPTEPTEPSKPVFNWTQAIVDFINGIIAAFKTVIANLTKIITGA